MYSLGKTGFVYITGQIGSFISFLVSDLQRKAIVFYDAEEEALLLKEEVEFFSRREAYLFPIYANRVFEKEDELRRLSFLYHVASDSSFIGLFPYSALQHPLPVLEEVSCNTRVIRFGDTVFQEELLGYLEDTGYEMASLVREQGEYAKRGSIIDVFAPSHQKPIRMEFLGDQIYSIRFFDPATQRSMKEMEQCDLAPVRSAIGANAVIFDYIVENMVLVHKGLDYVTQSIGETGDDPAYRETVRRKLVSNLNIDISGIRGDEEGETIEALSNEDLRHLFEINKTEIFKTLIERLKGEWIGCRYIYIFANTPPLAERLHEILKSYDLMVPIIPAIGFPHAQREWGIVIGPLRRGFRTKDIIILTEEDIVGSKKRVMKKKWDGLDEFLNSFKDLNVGEWVVHVEHGIGVYKGIMELAIGGYRKDFLLIEYQDGDKLYVPIDDLHLVQKFIGSEKQKPKIDKLGSQVWRNTKSRVRKHIEDIATELIGLYAERELAEGYQYPPEDELFREMEERFEYEETEDQSRAIEDVVNDLRNEKPMDRLICGDVGFGKTEVALRASFKVVMENKQAALLVPTTILAQQHFKTFSERFAEYPITVEMLSRFRSKDRQKMIVEGLRKGTVDIIIGTHRLVQKDITFKDLGLLIIDEEHRFGVKHKEKLKFLKKNIDVLTLSATPIPRTLHMATTGIKDLSIINTPPLDRLAVKTLVVKYSDEIIKKAVLNELQRGGQVFFVHNYIYNIGVVYDHLRRLLPDAKIAVAHGRMDERQLEKVMLDFIDGKYEVLLSTNIIESGLDISNVNTICINNAHRLGLADLYQLRGRVGRSTKQAYAYLLVPKEEVLTKDAMLRLKIIEEMTELGSGFHIANYDLEIRGAGNLLGKEQSGNVNLIGFELYCSLLEETVRRLKNSTEPKEEEIITEINIPIDAFIPDSYIEDPTQKLLTYKRLSKVQGEEELREMSEELKDRFGAIPKPLGNLLEIVALKSSLTKARIKKLEHSGKQVIIHVTEHTPVNMEKLLRLVKGSKSGIKLLPDGRIVMQTEKRAEELINLTRNVLMQIIPL